MPSSCSQPESSSSLGRSDRARLDPGSLLESCRAAFFVSLESNRAVLGSDPWKSIPALSWNRIGLFSIPYASCQSRSVHLRPDSDIESNQVPNRAHNRNRIGLGSGFDLFRNRIGFLGKDRFGPYSGIQSGSNRKSNRTRFGNRKGLD